MLARIVARHRGRNAPGREAPEHHPSADPGTGPDGARERAPPASVALRAAVIGLALLAGACTVLEERSRVSEQARAEPSNGDDAAAQEASSSAADASGDGAAEADEHGAQSGDPQASSGDEVQASRRVALVEPGRTVAEIERRKAELAASAADPLPAGEAGYYMDLQEANLRQHLELDSSRIVREGRDVVVVLAGTHGFDTGEAAPNAQMTAALERVARVVAQYPMTFVAVHAHTDEAGPADFNARLSEQRALAVAGRLVAAGIEADRVVAIGHGESTYAPPGESAGGSIPSRRVEVHLQPVVQAPARTG